MSLSPGARLGPYEIIAAIGAGGMGEVYRARDTQLNRDVAIKILPAMFAADADRVARFQREAQIVASLNHPNIAQIHGLENLGGGKALILELVEGPTLADRIAQGPIPLDEALPIARQIADALEAAHEHGVIHRDLKPANIKLKPDGMVKVLDFGLAKALADESSLQNVSLSPTVTSPAMATHAGIILGTAAYMSPEQAKGKAVDKRTDVWAFGCVLYEMLTGKRAFGGEDVSDTLAEIIKGEPPWNALPAATPTAVRRLLRRCLEKDRRNRLSDMADARLEILEAASPSGETQPIPWAAVRNRERLAWIVLAACLTLGLLVAAIPSLLRSPEQQLLYQTAVPAPRGTTFGSPVATPASFMAISPDGRRLVFVATDENRRSTLWVRPLDSMTAQSLQGTEGAREPFWSPDSRFIAFIADGKLKRVDASGGSVLTITEPAAQTGSWNEDDVILFVPTNSSPVHRVPASGGPSAPVSVLDTAIGERTHDYPVFLPDGRHFLYIGVGTKVGPNDAHGVYVTSLDAPTERKRVLDTGSTMQYSQGHLLFLRDSTLLAKPFDLDRFELTGEAVPIAEQVAIGGISGRGGAFSAATTGVLAYQSGSTGLESQLRWFDRSGKQINVVGESGDYADVELSPDDRYAAVSVLDALKRTRDIWLFDLVRNIPQKFTFDAQDEIRPVWSPDGKFLAFGRRTESGLDLYRKATGGTAPEELLHKLVTPLDWSPDGRHILCLRRGQSPGAGADLWVLSLEDRQTRPYLSTPFNESAGTFSPDGRWVAYISNETGMLELYVVGFPAQGRRVRVSSDGAVTVRWRKDGRELFYGAPEGTVTAVAVDGRGPEFEITGTQRLFQARVRQGYPGDVTADGKRFLLNALLEDSFAAPITLVVNWPELLRKRLSNP